MARHKTLRTASSRSSDPARDVRDRSTSVSSRDRRTVPTSLRDAHGSSTPSTDTGTEDDSRVIQVAIRCRARKRRRTTSASGLRANSSEWQPRRRNYDGGLGASDASSSDSDTDASSLDRSATTTNTRRSAIDFNAPQRRGGHSHDKPSLSVHTHAQSTSARRFEFDYIFPPTATQRDVFDASVQQQVAHVLQAHEERRAPTHATIVAYGQTGTEKTYTMGMLTSVHDDAERGLIPRAVAQIIAYADQRNRQPGSSECARTVVTMSYLQIYLETIQDLLVFPVDSSNPASTGASAGPGRHSRAGDLQVRQKPNHAFYVEGLSEYEVASVDDVHVLLETAARNRVLASTSRNKTSSRSHTLLTIALKRSTRRRRQRQEHRASVQDDSAWSDIDASSSASDDEEGGDVSDSASEPSDDDGAAYTISFVDLAGSERVDGALHFLSTTRRRQELRIREAKFINRSLSALGSVIAALAQSKRPRTSSPLLASQSQPLPHRHIRFRDSQLTKLLQARLERGSGRLLLIATIDDERANVAETLSTLKFASQCRRVELRSPRSAADAKRKDSLLEQVFREMKISYEEREAALHREYQDRLASLDAQLQVATRSSDDSKRQRDAALRASYAALCALADQTSGAMEQRQECHPALASFESEQELLAHIKALYVTISTALTPTSGRGLARVHSIAETPPSDSDTSQSSSQTSWATATPCASDSQLPLTPAFVPIETPRPGATKSSLAEQRAASCTLPPPPPRTLLPEHEREFQAVARWLLTAPERLRAYHVATDDDEVLDQAFSQIDGLRCSTTTDS